MIPFASNADAAALRLEESTPAMPGCSSES